MTRPPAVLVDARLDVVADLLRQAATVLELGELAAAIDATKLALAGLKALARRRTGNR